MELVLLVLAMVVILVGIDAGFRLDERRQKSRATRLDRNTPVTDDKIVVDMNGRDHD